MGQDQLRVPYVQAQHSRSLEGHSTSPVASLSFGTVGGSWAFPAPLDAGQQPTPRPLSAAARSEVSQPTTPVMGMMHIGKARGSSSDGTQNSSGQHVVETGTSRRFSISEVGVACGDSTQRWPVICSDITNPVRYRLQGRNPNLGFAF